MPGFSLSVILTLNEVCEWMSARWLSDHLVEGTLDPWVCSNISCFFVELLVLISLKTDHLKVLVEPEH